MQGWGQVIKRPVPGHEVDTTGTLALKCLGSTLISRGFCEHQRPAPKKPFGDFSVVSRTACIHRKNAGNSWGVLSSFLPLDLGAQELMAQCGESNTLPQVGTDPEVKLTAEFAA